MAGSNAGRSSFAATSDAQGLARVRYRLGTRAGAGNNRVEATATGFGGTAVFVVSAIAGNATRVNVDAGAGQTGSTGQALTFPFVVVVTDAGNNRLAHVPVTFRVREGGGNFDGVDTVTSLTDSDGRALAVLTVGAQPGYDNNVVEATAVGVARPAVFFASAKLPGTAADTRISGVVLDNSNLPLAGATLRLYRAYQASNSNIPIPIGEPVLSDAQGRFVIAPAPVGAFKLVADGTTIQQPSVAYPTVEYDIVTVSGQDNTLSLPETDLKTIDAAARKAGETCSAFLRGAALAEARRLTRAINDPKTRRAFSRLIRRAERRTPITTAYALAARDQGRG